MYDTKSIRYSVEYSMSNMQSSEIRHTYRIHSISIFHPYCIPQNTVWNPYSIPWNTVWRYVYFDIWLTVQVQINLRIPNQFESLFIAVTEDMAGVGFEPTSSCVQRRHSNHCATEPYEPKHCLRIRVKITQRFTKQTSFKSTPSVIETKKEKN